MIGQMIMVGFSGKNPSDPGVKALQSQIASYHIGGALLISRNIASPKQLRKLTDFLQDASPRSLPLLIAVDQEGGYVQRLSRKTGHMSFPSAWKMANDPRYGNGSSALKVYQKMADQLADAGINVNFGPVVDLNVNPNNPIIGRFRRSYGKDPERVVDYASYFVAAHKRRKILTAAKHFPGHGSSKTDSHKTFSDISNTWKPIELKPFEYIVNDTSVDMVMIGHLYHPQFSDGPRLPASLSKRAIAVLRDEDGVQFDGVVVSDDMEMGAIRKNFAFNESIIRAVNAGIDILIFSNTTKVDRDLGKRIHRVIRRAVNDGRIQRQRIEDAFQRIRTMKTILLDDPRSAFWR